VGRVAQVEVEVGDVGAGGCGGELVAAAVEEVKGDFGSGVDGGEGVVPFQVVVGLGDVEGTRHYRRETENLSV